MRKLSLRVLRAERGFRQSDVAVKAKMSTSRYQQFERGDGYPPNDAQQAAVCKVFGVHPDDVEWPTYQREGKVGVMA
jgi:transcriptional regulator with XRE-family HTH domain